RLELHVTDGVHLPRARGSVALPRPAFAGLALVVRDHRSRLRRALIVSRFPQEIHPTHLSFRRMNAVVFAVIAIVTLTFALAAATNPRLMHAALSFAAMFIGIAAFFFLLGAEFVGLVQVFVYVGAVAVLIVFTILLTRRDAEERLGFKWGGMLVAAGVFAGLIWAILKTPT